MVVDRRILVGLNYPGFRSVVDALISITEAHVRHQAGYLSGTMDFR